MPLSIATSAPSLFLRPILLFNALSFYGVLTLAHGCTGQDSGFRGRQAALLAWPSSHRVEAEPRHVRVLRAWHDDGKHARLVLQTATRSLVHPQTKKEVVLFATHAVATAEYFRSVDACLPRFGRNILVAGIVPESVTEPSFVVCMRRYLRALAQCAGLVVESSWMAKTRLPWQTVDLPIEAYGKPWEEMAFLNKALTECAEEFEAALLHGPGSPPVTTARARAMQCVVADATARDPVSDTHRQFLRRLDTHLFEALVALVKKPDVDHVAIVYDAASTEQIEKRVRRDLGFRLYATSWRDVLSYDYLPRASQAPAGRK